MSGKLTRDAYEKLIAENILAMELIKEVFVACEHRLEWEHIVAVLRASPACKYGNHEECLKEIDRLKTCTCGSGGHPRPCNKHPFGVELHAAEIEIEQLKEENDQLKQKCVGYYAYQDRVKELKEELHQVLELYHIITTYLEAVGPCENIEGEVDHASPYCDDLDCPYCNVAAAAYALIDVMPAYNKEVRSRRSRRS